MSSDADAAAAATVALYDEFYTGNYCGVAASVLFIYDAFITFDREIACFWTAKRRLGASLLFFMNKYISMVYFVTALAQLARFPSDKNCTVVLVSRIPLITADILLIYITWTKLNGWNTLRGLDIRQSKRISLMDVLFRGGIIYFAVLFVLNVLHLVLTATAIAASGNEGDTSVVSIFTSPITAIIISRFLLELHEADQTAIKLDPDNALHMSRDSTPSFVSSLGGFVNPALSTRSNDDSFEMQVRPRSESREEENGGVPAESPQPDLGTMSSSSA
ncbi:hypothetical protein C8T65DRAFT_743581 [Cerioporus squamosus]|nr:hypothetical protein C8T65DRAFT_743581 [Cerioporus squamosus]